MAELTKLGHPMLAALLTVGLSAPVPTEPPPDESARPRQEAVVDELEILKDEESVKGDPKGDPLVEPSRRKPEAPVPKELEPKKEGESVRKPMPEKPQTDQPARPRQEDPAVEELELTR